MPGRWPTCATPGVFLEFSWLFLSASVLCVHVVRMYVWGYSVLKSLERFPPSNIVGGNMKFCVQNGGPTELEFPPNFSRDSVLI